MWMFYQYSVKFLWFVASFIKLIQAFAQYLPRTLISHYDNFPEYSNSQRIAQL